MDFQQVFNNLSERGRLEWELATLRAQVQHLQQVISSCNCCDDCVSQENGTSEA
tara:strand:+ start:646 stop:807 length:162 start_codon:yes stop_codon:yes gene_type:complete